MVGNAGRSPAANKLVGLLLGVVVLLGVPQAADAAVQSGTGKLLTRGSGYAQAGGSADVKAVQRRLARLGETPGPADGLYGPRTEAAVRALQARVGLAPDGLVGPATRKAIRTAPPRTIRRGAGIGVAGGSDQVRALQRSLRAAGARPGPADGKFGPATEAAVRRVQSARGLEMDGIAGPQTYAALERRAPASGEKRPATPTPPTGRVEERPPTADRPPASSTRPAPVIGDDDTGFPWQVIAVLAALAAAAAAGLVARRRSTGGHPARSVVSLGRGIDMGGASVDPAIGSFEGTAYAVEIPEDGPADERARATRFYVLDPQHGAPFWVGYEEVDTPLPPSFQPHPAPWAGRGGLPAGTPVLGYVTVPRRVPTRQAELYDQLARIEAVCKRRRLELVRVVRDVEPNGKSTLDRPGIAYAVAELEAGRARALVVCDVTRLGRSRAEMDALLERLADADAALVVLEPNLDTSTEEGREVLDHLELVRTERTKLARAPRRATSSDVRDRVLAMRDGGELARGDRRSTRRAQRGPP